MTHKIALGSAQWGMNYGISNTEGKPRTGEVKKILELAKKNGVDLIDTAYLYGDAESMLGKFNINSYRVVTKIPRLSKNKITTKVKKELLKTFKNSLQRMKLDRVYGLLIHNSDEIFLNGSEYLIEALNELKQEKLVKKIGVSLYDNDRIEAIISSLSPDIVQLPLNVFDQRFLKDGTLKYLKQEGIEIHSRSVFLQGLLLMDYQKIPTYFEKWSGRIKLWRQACEMQGFSHLEAALNFVQNIKQVDNIIIGFENSYQFKQCLDFSMSKRKFDSTDLASNDLEFINPTYWKV